jgi:hypothetical protein
MRTRVFIAISAVALVCAKSWTVVAQQSIVSPGATAQTSVSFGGRGQPSAPLTIVNPQHQEISEDRVKVLFLTTCQVVAGEFRRHADELDMRLTLVLGDGNERSAIANDGRLTLYLDRWNEGKFVDGVITGAMQHLATLDTRKKMARDILRRSNRIAPVSLTQLR